MKPFIFTLIVSTCVSMAATVDIFLMAGQSNMSGISDVALSAAEEDQYIEYYYELDSSLTSLTASSNGSFSTLEAGTHPSGAPIWGAEIELGRGLYQAGYTDMAIIKYAYTGQSLEIGYNSPNGTSTGTGVAWDAMIATYSDALQDIVDRGDTPVLRGFFWTQGESDALDGYALNYESNFTAFISDLEAELSSNYDTTNLRYVTAQTALNIGASATNINLVRNAQTSVMNSISNGTYFDTESFGRRSSSDIIHFNADGYNAMGVAFTEYYLAPEPCSSVLALIGGMILTIRRQRPS